MSAVKVINNFNQYSYYNNTDNTNNSKLIIGNNPWAVSSLYQFQYFCCPSCIFRVDSKQDFVDHTTTIHPGAENLVFSPLVPSK